jgi:hypothetical protein
MVPKKDIRMTIKKGVETKCLQKYLKGSKLNVTGDESWLFEYDSETMRQSEGCHTPHSPRQKKARMSKSKINTMIIYITDIFSRSLLNFVSGPEIVS